MVYLQAYNVHTLGTNVGKHYRVCEWTRAVSPHSADDLVANSLHVMAFCAPAFERITGIRLKVGQIARLDLSNLSIGKPVVG